MDYAQCTGRGYCLCSAGAGKTVVCSGYGLCIGFGDNLSPQSRVENLCKDPCRACDSDY
jgi:hypothetical protein